MKEEKENTVEDKMGESSSVQQLKSIDGALKTRQSHTIKQAVMRYRSTAARTVGFFSDEKQAFS